MKNVHEITRFFEEELCKYTGAPFAVALDNCSNALFLALHYELKAKNKNAIFTFVPYSSRQIHIPCRTYPAVPCEIIHAGGSVKFLKNYPDTGTLKGAYCLLGSNVIDSALRFTANMYVAGSHMCLSFTGPYKHLKLGKGGAILTDNETAYKWFKKARFSGRSECSYHEDDFDVDPVVGWNMYMMPEIAAKGIQLMQQFYKDGKPIHNEDLELPYPDLSKFKIYQ